MTILDIFLAILLIYIIKYTKLVRFLRSICRILDFSSLLIIEVIAENVKIKKIRFGQICCLTLYLYSEMDDQTALTEIGNSKNVLK